MAQQILSTNTFTAATWIVNSNATKGTHITLAGAMASASSGDTILLQTSVTENITLTPGVNICAWGGSQETPTISITGKLTMTAAGSVTISGIRLTTNSDYFLVISGVAASFVNLENCYLNILNASGINNTSTLGAVYIRYCTGSIATTGITLYVSTVGGISIYYTTILNPGNTTTASSTSTGILFMSYSILYFPLTFTGDGSLQAYHTNILPGVKCILTAGTGSVTLDKCSLGSLADTAATAGVGTTIIFNDCTVSSSNAAVIDGAGTIVFSNISFTGTSAAMTTTTQAIRRTSNDGLVVKTPGAYPYTTVSQDAVILVDTSSARTITPLASPLTGLRHIIKDSVGSAAANNITVTPSGQNIDGAASYTINTNYGSITIVYSGTQWLVI